MEKKAEQLQIAANASLNWLCQETSQALDDQPEFVFAMFLKHITHSMEFYRQGARQEKLVLADFRPPSDVTYLPIIRLQRCLQPHVDYFKAIILHGSVATHEVVPQWSDVDVLAVIRQEALEEVTVFLKVRQALRAAQKEILAFDPFQHHGIQVISESDLEFYPEFFLPVVVMRHGVSLFPKMSELTFSVRDSKEEQIERFYGIARLLQRASTIGQLFHHGRDGIYLHNNFANAEVTMYQFKYFVSLVLLLPSLFIELVEKSIYKKDSFEKITKYFDASQLELVRACEHVRRLAPTVKFEGNKIPLEFQEALGNSYFERAESFINSMVMKYETR